MVTLDTLEKIAPLFHSGGVFAAFDLETTGLNPVKDSIVEIGAVKFDKTGVMSRFSVLVHPGISMPPSASKVNNITDEMLIGKPPLSAVLPDFLRFIDGAVLVAHNAGFDCGFINESLKQFAPSEKPLEAEFEAFSADSGSTWRSLFAELPNPVGDTLVLAKEAFPGRMRYNLQDLSASLGISSRDAHRAEDDARVCMELFIRCFEEYAARAL